MDVERRFPMAVTVGEPPLRQASSQFASATPTRGITVKKHSRFESVEHLRKEWDALAQQVGADLFASFDWCATWWKHFQSDRCLELYIAYLNGELVGCVPLYR